MENIEKSKILKKLNLEENNFFLMSCHREENIDPDESLLKLVNVINSIDENYKIPIIISTHPRTKNKFKKMKIKFSSNVRLIKPLSFSDYNKLQLNAKLVFSDSGTISEEASILNFPAINIREANERPEAMEEGAAMMLGLDADLILDAIKILNNFNSSSDTKLNIPKDYDVDNVSEKVVKLIFSYTDYVNRKVWRK
tara:strand:+ start:9 stop:599 length:591 start_codon:yes stop_codon:yes gene_type:complete